MQVIKSSGYIPIMEHKDTQRVLQQRLHLKFHRIRVRGKKGADYVLEGLLQGSFSMTGLRFGVASHEA